MPVKMRIKDGTLVSEDEIVALAANGARIVQGNYAVLLRNDGTEFNLLLTASGDPYGSYNALRPFKVNLSTGALTAGVSMTGAYWGDFADFIDVAENVPIEMGKVYSIALDGSHHLANGSEQGLLGIASDTYSMAAGERPDKRQIPIAVGGFVLACVDRIYPPGTPLTAGKNGTVRKMKLFERMMHPERLLGVFYKVETRELLESGSRRVYVNGRHWIKVQ